MDYIEALTAGIQKIDAVFSNTNGQLMGETMAELTAVLVKNIRENNWFQRDIITGLMKSSLATDPNKPITVEEAKNLFFTHFKDRIKYKKFISRTDAKPVKISNADLDILWASVYQHCTYNSRKELYESIPEWDGIERIKTFMLEYFDCKDNPNFFLLFLTSVIGKIDDPAKNYCPFFFDFVGESKGCLAGDTKINVYTQVGTSYKQHKVRISRLFDLAQNESDTFIVRSFNEQTKEMGYSNAKVVYSGEKQCYLLTTEDEMTIECSANHRFYTDDGWKTILDLKAGDEIYVNAKFATNRRDKNYRSPSADAKEVCVKYHPVVKYDERKKCHRVRDYKIIWEANANNMNVKEYIDLLNNYDGRPLIVVPKGYDIHHKDGNHNNNYIENLELLTKAEHGRLHGCFTKPKQYLARKVVVKSVIKTKVKKTYDLSCIASEHNFVANEFITHNTGKTSFFFHLLGRHAQIQAMTSRRDDFFVNCYDGNNIIVIDDECTWVGGKDFSKLSYDEFKQLITSPVDKFSRKFQQPETHERAFIIVRTANEVHTVFTSNERRQIVFNIGLPEHTCRHWELGDGYMQQLLAEAKVYYEKHGVYKMQDEDWTAVEEQNMRNFNIETDDFDSVKTFAEFLKTASMENIQKYTVQIHGDSGYWFTWNTYKKYCDDNKYKHSASRAFANQLVPLATYYPELCKYTKEMRRIKDTATYVHAAKLTRPDLIAEEDLADVPF